MSKNNTSSHQMIKTANMFSALQNTATQKLNSSKTPQSLPSPSAPSPSSCAVTKLPVLQVSCWADCEDDDDEEFFAHIAPLPPVPAQSPTSAQPAVARYFLEDEEEDAGEEDDEEKAATEEEPIDVGHKGAAGSTTTAITAHPMTTTAITAQPMNRIQSRRKEEKPLTKKEQKRRELAELDATLAEFGITPHQDRIQSNEALRVPEGAAVTPNMKDSRAKKNRDAADGAKLLAAALAEAKARAGTNSSCLEKKRVKSSLYKQQYASKR